MKYENPTLPHPDRLGKFVRIIQTALSLPIMLAMGVTTIDFGTLGIKEVITNIDGGEAHAVQKDNAVTIGDGETAGVITEAGVGYKVLDFNRPGKKKGGATVLWSHTVNILNGKFDVRGNRKSIEVSKGDTVTIPGTDITVSSS